MDVLLLFLSHFYTTSARDGINKIVEVGVPHLIAAGVFPLFSQLEKNAATTRRSIINTSWKLKTHDKRGSHPDRTTSYGYGNYTKGCLLNLYSTVPFTRNERPPGQDPLINVGTFNSISYTIPDWAFWFMWFTDLESKIM